MNFSGNTPTSYLVLWLQHFQASALWSAGSYLTKSVSLFLLGHTNAHSILQTLEKKSSQSKVSPQSYGSVEPSATIDPCPESYSVRQLLAVPIIRALCASGCALSFISAAFDVLFVLFCYTPVVSGGLGFSVSLITTFFCTIPYLTLWFRPRKSALHYLLLAFSLDCYKSSSCHQFCVVLTMLHFITSAWRSGHMSLLRYHS